VAEVTYYVALPFGCERRRCGGRRALGMLQSVAVVMRAEALSRREATSAPSRLAALAALQPGISATPEHVLGRGGPPKMRR
jgi:hypothetical protein